MPKTTMSEEVQVLRFFETGPIEKVEVLFNIICEKMRERLRDRGADGGAITARPKRRRKEEIPAPDPNNPETRQ